MGQIPTGKPNGRPRIRVRPVSKGLPEKEIVLDQVIYWIGLQATAQEIASSFHVSTFTLDKAINDHFGTGFLELKKRCEGTGKLSLRRYQFKQAEKNASMAIWLGKQWLGQSDHQEKPDAAANDPNITIVLELMKQNQELIKRLSEIERKLYERDPGQDQQVQSSTDSSKHAP